MKACKHSQYNGTRVVYGPQGCFQASVARFEDFSNRPMQHEMPILYAEGAFRQEPYLSSEIRYPVIRGNCPRG